MTSFNALVLRDKPEFSASIESLSLEALPPAGDVTVRVEWSGINYKDGLAVTNTGKIIRGAFPFVPGIDLAGVVESSSSPDFNKGDRVVSTGWGLGESKWGGYSQYQRLDASCLLPIPDGLSTREAMIIGTAGLTAMLAALEIEKGPGDKSGPYLVTGATGGVGSFSIMALAHLGYNVVAATGKPASEAYLRTLGASSIVERQALSAGARTALDSAKWSGCVDSVGSTTLEAVLSQTARHGTVAACGLAGGPMFKTSVFPFILRGVRLIGIDSNTCPNELRMTAWNRLATLAAKRDLGFLAQEVHLDGIVAAANELIAGRVTGRYIVRIS